MTDARNEKSDQAFRTIGEVSEFLDIPQHVLRFWETKFSQVKPLKRGGGRRYYRPDDVALLRRIRDLLYSEGYTIRGVQKLIKERGIKSLVADVEDTAPASANAEAAADVSATRISEEEGTQAQAVQQQAGLTQHQREQLTQLRDGLKRLRDRV